MKLKKYTFPYTGKRAEKALKKFCVLGLTTEFIQCILKAQNKFSVCTLKIELPHIFPTRPEKYRIPAYQGHAGEMERNI